MTTPRIEEMKKRIIDSWNAYSKGEMVDPVPFMEEIVTTAHQAGIDEAVEIVRKVEPTGLPDSYSESDDIISREDTIKALQDETDHAEKNKS